MTSDVLDETYMQELGQILDLEWLDMNMDLCLRNIYAWESGLKSGGYRNDKRTKEPGGTISKVDIKRPSEQRCGVTIVLAFDGHPRQSTDRHC
jgi:hypothetical protein